MALIAVDVGSIPTGTTNLLLKPGGMSSSFQVCPNCQAYHPDRTDICDVCGYSEPVKSEDENDGAVVQREDATMALSKYGFDSRQLHCLPV